MVIRFLQLASGGFVWTERSIIFRMVLPPLLFTPRDVAPGASLGQETDTSGVLHFRLPTTPSACVLHQIRTLEGATRSRLRDTLGMSQPSVTRHVRALREVGLVEERQIEHDGERPGRPHAVLGLDGRHLIIWGAHIGARSTHLTITDGAGRMLRENILPVVVAERTPSQMVAAIAQAMEHLAGGLPRPVSVGVVVSAHLDRSGIVSSLEYGWEGVDLSRLLSQRLGCVTRVGTGVAAMAARELLSRPIGLSETGSALYFYAREVINHAWIVNGAVHRPHSGRQVSSFDDLARGSVLAQGEEHPYSAAAAVSAANRAGIRVRNFQDLVVVANRDANRVANWDGSRNSRARAILDARADLLSGAITLILDAVDPAVLVLAGEAFTSDRAGLNRIVDDLRKRHGGPEQLGINLAGPAVIRDAARLAGLFPLWQEPLCHTQPR